MSFSTGTGLECVWGRWVGPGLVLGRSTGCASSVQGVTATALIDRSALDVALLCKKNEREGGRRGLRPWPLRCLSQILPEIEDGLL